MIIMLKKKGKASRLGESLLKHVYSLLAKEFISCGQCIITPGFSLVSIFWSCNRKSNRNLPLLQRRLHTARHTSSVSWVSTTHLQPLEHPLLFLEFLQRTCNPWSIQEISEHKYISGWYSYYRSNIHRRLIVRTMLKRLLDSLALA